MKKKLAPLRGFLLLATFLNIGGVVSQTEKSGQAGFLSSKQQKINGTKEKVTLEMRTIDLNDYDFIAPEGWQVQKLQDHILLQNMSSGCAIRMVIPQPSSGDLEKDAKTIFDLMYQGWQFQKSGEQQYVLSKGILPKGLEYYMMEAPMSMTSADGRYFLEEGAALVIKTGSQIVIASVRHNSSLFAHDGCYRNYNTWRRFFNSLHVKNTVVPTRQEEDVSKRIIGKWSQTESGASAEYVFAANGNYALIGALGSSRTTTDFRYEYLHLTTYAFKGDGRYAIHDNQLRLIRNGISKPEIALFRFDKVNHGGGGWNDRVHLLKTNAMDGKEYEVSYEKKIVK